MSNTEEMIDALQALLSALIDTEREFEEAAEKTHSFAYYAEFERDAARRANLVRYLRRLIGRLGRKPDMGGSTLGLLKRWLNGLRGHQDQSGRSIRFLEKEEWRLARTIRSTLDQSTLPEALRAEVVALLQSLSGERERLNALDARRYYSLHNAP